MEYGILMDIDGQLCNKIMIGYNKGMVYDGYHLVIKHVQLGNPRSTCSF